jgi:uncharacterized protein (TIGR00725 family)
MRGSRIIGVVGAAQPSESGYVVAREVGRLLGEAGAILVCGGLGGVMEAACRGCREAGGQTVGILPEADAREANPWVAIPIVTGMGHARNVIIAHTATALIAVEGEYGTVSEMAIALKLGRPVVTLKSRHPLTGARPVRTPAEAVSLALADRAEDKEGFDAR